MAVLNVLNLFLKGVSISVAIILIAWQIFTYVYLDDDLPQVDFKRFHSTKDRIYPALTLCFNNSSPYKHYETTQKDPQKDGFYEDASNCTVLKIEDYIKTISVRNFENEISKYTKSIDGLMIHGDESRLGLLSTGFVLRRYRVMNCFAIGIPFVKQKEIKSMRIRLRKSIFTENNDLNPCLKINEWSRVTVGLSYRNQFFSLLNRNGKEPLDAKELSSSSGFVFHVSGIEIVNRRNKQNDPCNNYANEQAIKKLEDLENGLGCKAQSWNSLTSIPDCPKKNTKRFETKIANDINYSNVNLSDKPCRYIQNLWHQWSVDKSINEQNDTFSMTVVYSDLPFKEITFIPLRSIANLVMNIMAIIGFVLGFSMYKDVPNIILNRLTSSKSSSDDLIAPRSETDKGMNYRYNLQKDKITEPDYSTETTELIQIRHERISNNIKRVHRNSF